MNDSADALRAHAKHKRTGRSGIGGVGLTKYFPVIGQKKTGS